MSENILLNVDGRGVATVTLNRPDKHNAFGDELIAELTGLLKQLDQDSAVRVLVLTGAGESFSAGADLNWMRAMAGYSEQENFADALKLADLMATLECMSKPTVARVNGHAFGGAVGLIACCDIALASKKAKFCLSEVRLGLVPAVISPYVMAAIGLRQARRLFLTAEAISAKDARKMGLVHDVAKPEELDELVEEQVSMLLKAGPRALAEAKRLAKEVAGVSGERQQALRLSTSAMIARLRVGEEGQEGLNAFLDKRPPAWVKSD
ncbi:MAG: enoyl-CoA hydratase/isomerase family protein [Gammaproteobacteria bacterium]|nr:enoyl-CoA hydratase/isomerase family protein [Gammaproteobacteria bacterium]